MEAKRHIEKQAEVNKKYYDAKYIKPPPVYKVDELVRLKQPLTKVGLKAKLRNDKWSDPLRISRIISSENVEIELPNKKKKVVNVNNIKKVVDYSRNQEEEYIRSDDTVTRYGRVSRVRYQNGQRQRMLQEETVKNGCEMGSKEMEVDTNRHSNSNTTHIRTPR